MANCSLMKVESIAECSPSPWSILQYFDLHLAIISLQNQFFGLLFEWPLKTCFTVHSLYTMRLKFSHFSIQFVFIIKYAKVFYMNFIGCVLHNLTFYDHFECFLTSKVCRVTLSKSCQSHIQHSTISTCHLNLH